MLTVLSTSPGQSTANPTVRSVRVSGEILRTGEDLGALEAAMEMRHLSVFYG